MLNAKDIARKVASGCDHSTVIRIPCASCVERQMITWAAHVRDDFRASMKEEWASMSVEKDAAKRETEKLRKQLDAYAAKVSRLEMQVGSLGAQLKVAKYEAEEARIQLHAEQAIKSTVKMATV
jgi:septal ring factor EnvC (AmiA/AmiB activator)